MNKQYRIVWNDSTRTWIAVAETARAHGKSMGTRTGTLNETHTGHPGHAMGWLLRPVAMALALWCGLVQAGPPASTQLPTGGQVMAGQATVGQAGQVGQTAVLNVTQTSASAVINWNTFNLGSAASVNFAQPDRNAAVLNRVLDTNPSQIYGRISAPGQVFFSNPNGLYFSPSASVDVGGLVATTHSISTADFMAGKYNFTRDGASGAVVNDGQLQAALGGYVALLAPEVRNHGVVLAQMGAVALAAGESYQLQIQGSRLSQIDVTPATIRTLVENGQAVLAPGGWIVLSAKAAAQLEASVVNTGQLAANSLAERGGRIVLESTGTVSAGGSIQANSAQGQGGRVEITGEQIQLPQDSDIQATGANGGGTVLVGGDWQGSNGVPQASRVHMDSGARIDASATDKGNGGKVVLWSDVHKTDGQTTVHGSIRARGGVQGGDGGQIETSGHQVDIVGAQIDAGADQGQGGLWLLDPYDYTIGAAEATTIVGALNASTNFTVDTANASGSGLTGTTGTGVITVNSPITKTSGSATLTLNATDSILLNANITSTVGFLNVTLNATNGSISGSGNLALHRGMATFNQATDGIYSGVVGDAFPSQLTKSGTGTLILTGANIYTALTRISGGTLQIGNNGTVGSLASTDVDVLPGATLAFKRSDNLTINKTITGGGSVSQLANSNLTLTNNFSTGFTGDLIINAGQLTLSSPAVNSFYGQHIYINNGSVLGITATVGYWMGTNLVFDANGGGSIKMDNAPGAYVNWVADGLVFTTNGGLQNRIYSTVANPYGLNTNFTNPAGVIFNTALGTNTATADLKVDIPLVNGGALIKNGAGSVVITQDPTSPLTTSAYSTVAVNAGTFKVGNGGTGGLLGSGTATVAAGATLEFNRSDSISVSNSITGAGALTQQGNGSLTLSNNPNYSGATHINNGSVVWQNDAPSTSSSGFDGTGSLTIQPAGTSFTSAFSTAGWNLASTLSGLTLGKTGNTAGITVPSALSIAGPVSLMGGDLAINAALTATGNNTISLSSSGNVTDGASGALSASNLLLSGGNVALDSISNAIGTLAANGVSNLTFVNGTALSIGTVGGTNGVSASAVVDVATTAGDLTVSQTVSTTRPHAFTTSVFLNAGRDSAALTSTGGNLLVNGSGSVSMVSGNTARLYSGSVSGSTGLTALVGSGSGRFRYGSDESTTNYSLGLSTGLNAIYREQPTLARVVNDQTITYSGAWTNAFSITGGVNGDTYSQAFGSATAPTVTVGGSNSTSGNPIVGTHTLSATGGATSGQLGYAVNSATTSGTLTVNAKTLNVAYSGVNKAYDGNASATTTRTDDHVSGDVLTISESVAFTDKNAGTTKTINVSGITLGGADAGNYSLVSTTANTTADIAARPLTLTYTGVNKTYDGSASATVTRSDDRVAGDVLTIGGSASFADKNAGTGKAVSISGISLSGTDAGNYSLASTTASTTANIGLRPLRVYYIAASKTYDGGLSATVTMDHNNAISGDALTISQSAAFGDKNAGYDKPVYISGIAVGGADASNYALAWTSTIVRTDINPRPLALSYVGVNKTYDGSVSATVTRSDNHLTGDVLTVSENAVFADKNVGTAKTVNVSGISLSGADAGNYSLASSTANTSADIAAKVLTITGLQVAERAYDGTTNTTVTNWGQVNTGVGSETLLLTHGPAALDSANAGSRTAEVTGYSLVNGANGGLASNYRLSSTSASVSTTIAKALLQVVANNDAKFVTTGDATGYAGVSYSGFVNGETAAVLGSTPTVSRSNSNVHTAGIYSGVLMPAGGVASNYSFAYTPGDYTVVPANQLLVRMVPLSTTYGAVSNYSIANASYYDANARQVVTLAGTSVGAGNVVTVDDGVGGRANFTVTPLNSSLSSAQLLRVGVYALGVSGVVTENSQNFSDTITLIGAHTVNPKALAAVTTGGVSKFYDGSTSMKGVSFSFNAVGGGSGIASGDLVNATGNGDYANRNVGTQLAYLVNDLSLSGADASNYYIATGRSFSGNNGTITPKALTLTAMPDSKAYDGTTRSGVRPISSPLGEGDSFDSLVQSFDSSEVGVRSLNVTGYSLNDGNGGNNYVVTTRVPNTGSILSQDVPLPAATSRTWSAAPAPTVTVVNNTLGALSCAGGIVLGGTAIQALPDARAAAVGLTPRSSALTQAAFEGQDGACLRVQLARDVAREQVGLTRVYVPREALGPDAGFVFSVALPNLEGMLAPKASLRDGSALPDWLSVDAKTNRFTASKVPAGSLPLAMRLQSGALVMDVDVDVIDAIKP